MTTRVGIAVTLAVLAYTCGLPVGWAQEVSMTGRWEGTLTRHEGGTTITLTLSQDGEGPA